MSDAFECMMVVMFGISWPFSIVKLWRSKTAKGKSLLFSGLVWLGYVFGIISKLSAGRLNYVFIFYVINLVSVSVDIALFLHNAKYDRESIF